MATYSVEYLGAIVADYQNTVEHHFIAGDPAVGEAAAKAFANRWPTDAIRAAVDALRAAYALQHGKAFGPLNDALGRLARA
ncbi:hypothetical protein [Streptomyces sp. NPDC093225]|uniref:hypothetical protein n=1 Tax=Streptomyces sp. NPDC093225 TaxID=3366034 RepID=UPI00382D9207